MTRDEYRDLVDKESDVWYPESDAIIFLKTSFLVIMIGVGVVLLLAVWNLIK